MYKLGILGGMGPLATVKFYEKIVCNTDAKNDNEHIDLVILNHATLPDRTTCIINQQDDAIVSLLKQDLAHLERLGVQVVAIPCNTCHYYYDVLNQYSKIKFLNMVEETIKTIQQLGINNIVVFGTLGTLSAGVYNKYALKHNVAVKTISQDDQNEVMNIIYDIKQTNNLDSKKFQVIVDKYCDSDTIGIIACTELSLLQLSNNSFTIDAMDVLVKKCITECGYQIKG